jgi:hypothetical protein
MPFAAGYPRRRDRGWNVKFELKPISRDAVSEALQKAERYRLLNEPWEAQNICEDVLAIEPENQEAIVMLVLAITDQLEDGVSEAEASALLPRLQSEYQRAYYAGIIAERSAKAALKMAHPGSHARAGHELAYAMSCFERAEALRPAGNDDAVLRWNTCARILMRNPSLQREPEERPQEVLGE